MPGDFLPRREELARLLPSPIFLMGPELETTGVKLRLHYVTLQITPQVYSRGRDPGCSTPRSRWFITFR